MIEMEVSNTGASLLPKETDHIGMEAAQEINLDTSTTSEEEEAAIEMRKEKLRLEIKEVE